VRDLTLVLPYYENPGMLVEHQRVWAAYPDDLKARLHVIVVDDGSPTRHAREVVTETGVASFRLFRCLVDVRWNWIFCRNLAMAHAATEWALLTDIDHVMPGETLRSLTEQRLSSDRVYRLSRVDVPALTPYKPHPNTWLLTRVLFDRIGGYDERFSGFYGSDFDFRDRAAAVATLVMLPDRLIRYPREVIADASTTTYGRKEPQDRPNVRRILATRDGQRPKRLTFAWEAVPC